jgi:APA family basic amino acid/polyamine antiporter
LFATKPLHRFESEAKGENRLKRVLGPLELINLGIGCIIGTGIFVMIGVAAHDKAGPVLSLSFVVAGFACAMAGLCYAEFAAMVPVAGSAYTYAYATLGELFAWIIGWDLLLEYTVAAAAVASGWSGYMQSLLKQCGIHIPKILSGAPFAIGVSLKPELSGTAVDLLAVLVVVALTVLLVKGIKESTSFNNVIVAVKVAVVLFVIAVGAFFVKSANWHPFAPFGFGGLSFFGHVIGQKAADGAPLGMLAGAAFVFFAYIGFDTVSAHSEEAKNPQRDVPAGIIGSLLICTVLYIAVAAVLTGMVRYSSLSTAAPVADAFRQVGLPWAQALVSLGAIAGITTVLLALMLGQPRVLLAMARDGLIPKSFFSAVHCKFCTPWKSTILNGIVICILAGLIPLKILAELVNIGTLLAFVIVCTAVLIMRKTNPDAKRPFRCPWVPVVPILGIVFCLALMLSLPTVNWIRLGVWLVIGLVIYGCYGRRHSVLRQKQTMGK